jgi:hypothetical protein
MSKSKMRPLPDELPIKNLNLHNVEIHPTGMRFIVLHHVRGWHVAEETEDGGTEHVWHPNTGPIYDVYGGAHPTLFKTIRNAFKVASERYFWLTKKDKENNDNAGKWRLNTSKVLVFDPNYLPLVAADDQLFEMPAEADKLTEAEFCERQVGLWADLHERALKREKPPVIRCGVEGCRLAPGHEGLHKFGPNIP